MKIQMTELAFRVLNGPICLSNLFAYYFLTFCLLFWQKGAKPLKQPLKFLLVSFVTLMGIHQINVLSQVFYTSRHYMQLVVFFVFECSLTTAVWLGIFYYTQIVPPHSMLTIWLKKNIKWTVYIVMTLDKLLFLTDIVLYDVSSGVNSYADNLNGTLVSSNRTTTWDSLTACSMLFYFYRVAYILLSSVVMTTANCATARYLKRHIKNMASCRSPFASSVRSQMRVTTSCNVQGILNLLCSTWFLLQHLLANVAPLYFDNLAIITAISLYSFGTAVNLCVGQSIFRKRAVDLWLKVCELLQLKKDN